MRRQIKQRGATFLSKEVQSQILSRITDSKSRLSPRLRWSPTRILSLFLKSKFEAKKSAYRSAFLSVARMRNGRLPVLTLQSMLARTDLSADKRLAAALSSKDETYWQDAFNSAATRGHTLADVEHWAWILSAKDGDGRIERLVSTDSVQPIFLIGLVLRNDEIIKKPESLAALVKYIKKHHLTLLPSTFNGDSEELEPAFHVKRKRLGTRKVLTVTQFLIILRRLVGHILKVRPRFLVNAASLAANYIRAIPYDSHHTHHLTDYRDQCLVFNSAMDIMGMRTEQDPLLDREYNWRAQKMLLAASDSLARPLIINKASYRAIRKVLVGLQRTHEERSFALRYGKSWPPHRQDFDGHDAKRTFDDDRSRSFKAGVLMRESGYTDTEYDRALDALGGVSDDFTPTIQTRSLPPKEWEGEEEDLNAYSNWAMNVRSTRNAQEAWRAFNKFARKTGLEPNLQVYTEMFLKLLARPVEPDANVLPGDTKDAFPVHNANYSAYELARLSPPSVAELYAEMKNRGIRPVGYCLYTLVSTALSVEEGLGYLKDSGMSSECLEALTMGSEPTPSILRKVPLLSFSSYIELLCNLQPNRRGRQEFWPRELYPIHHAIKLVHARLYPHSTEAATFRPPWHRILRALTRNDIVIQLGTPQENNRAALELFVINFKAAMERIGLDAELFILLCRVVQKVVLSTLRTSHDLNHVDVLLMPWVDKLLPMLTQTFSHLTVSISGGHDDDEQNARPVAEFQFPVGAPHLHAYMRALACLGAKDEMVRLVLWMMTNYQYVDEEANRLPMRGRAMVAKALCVFQAYAFPALDEHVQQDLSERMKLLEEGGASWRWPSPEEVDSYVEGDRQGGTDLLEIINLRGQSRPNLRDGTVGYVLRRIPYGT